jgi:hypothetical protein
VKRCQKTKKLANLRQIARKPYRLVKQLQNERMHPKNSEFFPTQEAISKAIFAFRHFIISSFYRA